MTEYCQSLLDTIDDLRAENERLRAQCDGTTCVSRETLMVTEYDLIAARSRVSALESALREIGERCSRACRRQGGGQMMNRPSWKIDQILVAILIVPLAIGGLAFACAFIMLCVFKMLRFVFG